MTTGIAALDFAIAGFALAWALLLAYAARQWIVRHLGRAKPLPEPDKLGAYLGVPELDEAGAPEGAVVPRCRDCGKPIVTAVDRLWHEPAPMQGNSAARDFPTHDGRPMRGSSAPVTWPYFSYDPRLPRRKGE